MSVAGVLAEALRDGIYLHVEDNKLKYVAAKDALSLELRRKLAEYKDEIIDHLVRDAAASRAGDAPSAIPPLDRASAGPLPLSFGQQRLWFFHQYMGPNAVYNIPLELRLHGDVNEAALRRSLRELHRRHESLRTRFEPRDGGVVQVIDPPSFDPVVEVVSAREARAIARTERAYCFDLSSEPLCRIRLLREAASDSGGAGDYVLLVTMHHSVSDGWSAGIFFRELVASYRAYVNGTDPPLEPLPIQYADYAEWQRRWLQGEVLERQLSYWRTQLAGLPPFLALPTDRPRPAEQTYRGSIERFALPASLVAKLQALTREQGATLYMTLLSAFAVLLGRYSGQQDVAVGTPIANRTRRETEGLIGFFVNTLVMRHDLSGDPRFVDLLERTRAMALEVYAHQDIPFEQLVEELNPQRSAAYSPLFQVSFSLVNTPATDPATVADLSIEAVDGDAAEGEGIARYDLTCNVLLTDAGITGTLEYNTDLFERGTMRRLSGHYERLLAAIVAAPQARLSQLEILDDAERRQQLIEWNATARAYPEDTCVHELLERQVSRQPDAIAVAAEHLQLSYAELNRRANRVAHRLRELGVGPDVRVGLCMERSPELVVGLLAILKAGGAYVPLDPEYPEARLEYMLAQSDCRVVLSEQHLMADLPLLSRTKVLPLDARLHAALFGAYGDADVPVAASGVRADNLAYVIYTSGSTGQPKGSAIVHRNISRLIHNDFIDFASARTILCAASPSFDAFTFELWGALLHGGRSVMGSAAETGFSELGSVIDRQGVDCAWLTSSLFNRLIDTAPESLRGLRRLLVGGEALSIGHIRAGLRQLPQTVLINGYGPTENTTFSCTCAIGAAMLAGRSSVPIGRPIGNTQAYVLGPQGELVPRGVAGELYLGGAGLARGYLAQPGMTAQKFVPNPFAPAPGERLYRTGDLARYLPDGSLEFIGRVDSQVKVRGFRIELGEIESVLRRHEAVRDAVVRARESASGERSLVAYVAAAQDGGDARELQRSLADFLRAQLPDYMVPAAFVLLDALPLTVNKKVDVDALPAPDDSAYARAAYQPPQTEMEQALAKLWQDNLGLEMVGTGDNYFSIGGDSIRSIALVSEAKQRGLRFSVKDLFSHPTIAALAQVAEAVRCGEDAVPKLEPFSMLTGQEQRQVRERFGSAAIEDAFPLSTVQQGLIFHSLTHKDLGAYHDILTYRIHERWDAAAFERALSRVISRHGMLRTVFDLRGARPLQVVFEQADADIETVAIDDVREAERIVERWIEQERRQGIDLTSRPWKIRVHVLADGEFILGMSFHHALYDGWSNATFLNELLTGYSPGAQRGDVEQTAPPPSYRHFVALEQQAAASQQTLAWWRRKLDGARVPWWTGDLRAQSAYVFHELAEESSDRLVALAATLGVQEKSVWTAIYLALVALLDGSNDIVGAVATHGRPEIPGSEKTLGLFLNSLPVRVDTTGMRWKDLVLAAEAELQALHAVRHFPLVRIQAQTGMSFSASLFNFVNFHVYEKNVAGGQLARGGAFEETNYRLTFQVQKFQDLKRYGIHVSLDPSVFDEDFRERIQGYVVAIVERLLGHADERIDRTKLLGHAETATLLEAWNAPARADAPDQCIHERFEAQAARMPDAVALVHEGHHLTYAELNGRANALAHELIARGAGPEARVGLCMPRSAGMVVGLLGILKAGGASVPLDPAWPALRLSYVIEDSGTALIVGDRAVEPADAQSPGAGDAAVDWLYLDALRGAKMMPNPPTRTRPESLAALIYTAEHGGELRGVAGSHRGLIDIAPVCGGRHGREVDSSAAHVPSAGSAAASWDRGLAVIMAAAEGGADTAGGVGRPRGNFSVHVLGPDGDLLPRGVVGELHLGGAGLARGYWNRPDLTAERFVPHPFSREPGARLYRTGELARWLPDGTLERVGRLAARLEVRGFRIEPGEIERVLRAHEGVRDAVVVARRDARDTRLVAYVVATAGAQVDAARLIAELRRSVQKQLPGYAVPAAFVLVPDLPATASGDVDRDALPAPDDLASAPAHVPPEGVTEELLAQLWATVLEHERVGRHDNFFELGGHSLLAMQLVSRIRATFATELPLRELFEHATLAAQARAIERARGAGALADVAMEPASRDAPLALSHAQQRLWFLHQYMGPSAVYNMPLALRLQGAVDEAALLRSLEELDRRHEALRTRFEARDGGAVQVIDAPSLTLVVEAVSAAEAQAIARAEREHRFDLSRERLCRIRLLREMDTQARDHLLLVTMHHSVSDGWSLGIFFRELVSLYRAFTRGQRSPLAPLAVQYADYAQWQRRWLEGEVLEQQLSYWRVQLEGLPPLLTLPTDRPRPAEQSFRGRMEHFALPVMLSEKLQALSRERGVTLYMTLLSAFAALLGRYSGQQEVAIGTPVANRTRRETEGVIGFFVNMLVMRHDLRGNPRFTDLLEGTRETALQAYAHQDVPFEQLVEELNPGRSVGHSPLFQVSFGLVNTPFEAVELPDLAVLPLQEEAETQEGTSRFDLTLNVQESPAGLVGVLEYNTDLFERGTMRRLLGHYERLLTAIVAAPQARLSQLEILDDAERRQQLIEWNTTARAYPEDTCVHELLERQVSRQPDAIAVAAEHLQLSYAELNRRANRVAHRLRELGVGPDVRVGLCMERSPELAVGLLAILKAGGAYVPLDPEYPEARLEYMLAQSDCRVVLSEQHLVLALPLLSTAKVLPLDARLHEPLFGAYSDENVAAPESGVRADNLAYVIYTSGSTGQPKGSAIVHRNISRLIHNDFIDFASARTILCAASPSFDAFTFELWGALLHGGRSVMGSAAETGFSELGSVIDRQGVDCAWLTSSLFNRLIDTAPESLRGLRRLLVGGEALSIGHIRAGLRQLPQAVLINGYGPTENTTFSCTYAITAEALAGRASVPIGRPIGNTQAYVLGADDEMVPAGVVGELYLGGAGLARGYLAQPGMTAQKFVPNPFAPAPGERLYRTGDLARYLPDGSLEFIGRVDSQVKVRGFRIELGEIESVLRAHEAVRDAVVRARQNMAGERSLVAYVAAERGASRGLQRSLLEYLRARLPDYMVPAAFVLLDALPLTVNKKVDVDALPAPDDSAYARAAYQPPRTPLEQALAKLWQDNLGLEQVGIDDNYFAVGGDSIRSIALVAEAKQRGLELSVKDLFSHPTIAALAQVARAVDCRGPALPQLEPFSLLTAAERGYICERHGSRDIEDAFPLSTLQQGLIYHSLARKDLGAYHDILTYRIGERWDAASFTSALGQVVARHGMLRTVFDLGGARPIQVVFRHAEPRLEVVAVADAAQTKRVVEQWIAHERQQGMDLSSHPWKMRVHVPADGGFVLGVSFHHALYDGWSDAALFNELLTTYSSYLERGQAEQAPPPPSYRHFVALEQQAAASEQNAAYWRDKLEGARLPWWTGDLREHSAAIYHEVAEGPASALLALAATLGVQEKSLWTAVYLALLSLLDGSDDVVGSVVTHGRPEIPGGEKTLGLFLNSLPVRVDLAGLRWKELVLAAESELQALHAVRHFPLIEVQARTGMSFSASLFNFVSFHVYEKNVADRQLVRYGGSAETSYPLTFQVHKFQDRRRYGIHVNLDPAVFDEEFRARIHGYVVAIIERLLGHGDERIDKTALLGHAEVARLLATWNATARAYPRRKCIHELFEEQARLRPDAVALVYEDAALTYGEVNRRANQLAHRLLAHGVGPEVRVGLCMARSAGMVVGLLGILKAGGAYVPLDPGHPRPRLAHAVADAGLVLMVGDAAPWTFLDPAQRPSCVPAIDGRAAESLPATDPAPPPPALATAYVIYTSGSTGKPKGVRVSHANVVNFLLGMQEQLQLGDRDRLLAVTTPSFDIALLELYLPLTVGGTVDIAPAASVADGERLMARLEQSDITLLQGTPVTWKLLLDSGWEGRRSLTALVGGEAFSRDLATKLTGRVSRIWNLYGPTETTIWSAAANVAGAMDTATVPIGQPIANTQLHVLDEQQQLLPAGTVGQLYIAGAGVTPGYLNRPALTAQKFIPHPFARQPGERLYATGDLARWLRDGTLEFLGRVDHQVKVRGFRIELGEIESVLRAHEQVRDAVVVALDDSTGSKRLVGYVVAESGAQADEAALLGALRARLHEHLPGYMVPAALMVLASLPLTANGKIDRRALPAPEAAADAEYTPPQGATEELLAGIWSAVLGRERVGRHESFFELGGHSLLAIQLASRIRETFSAVLSMQEMFEHATLASQASAIERAKGASALIELPLEAASDEESLPLSFAQERMLFLDEYLK